MLNALKKWRKYPVTVLLLVLCLFAVPANFFLACLSFAWGNQLAGYGWLLYMLVQSFMAWVLTRNLKKAS